MYVYSWIEFDIVGERERDELSVEEDTQKKQTNNSSTVGFNLLYLLIPFLFSLSSQNYLLSFHFHV